MNVDAIIWDYDGTLVNSASKNIAITRQILDDMVPRLSGENLPVYLKSERAYHEANHKSKNWQDLYINYYGLTETETQKAGSLWTEYQLKNLTPVELFPEIKQTISKLHLPLGICSQNSAENIRQVLATNELLQKFNSIIGYDDVPGSAQKPSAFSGIKCIENIFSETKNKTIVYIGDHEGDVEFARNIEAELDQSNSIISIIVTYSGANTDSWVFKPDYEISSPYELLDILTNQE